MDFTVAVSGDTMITSSISRVNDQRFLRLMKIFAAADVAFTHFETLIHDYEGPELYPAAEAGWGWMRSPRAVAHDLKTAGFDVVSLASNHSFDYSYGGLFSTWRALEDADVLHVGTGRTLGDARAPGYLETSRGRVAVLSMTSSAAASSHAGDARRDMKGRPGVNPLRYFFEVDPDTMNTIRELAMTLGWWITEIEEGEWLLHPPGLHNSTRRYKVANRTGTATVAEPDDVEDNLRAVREARSQSDLVMVHVHCHEWNPEQGLSAPPKFLPPFARACIDAGADIFIAEGSHAPLRGIEIYKSKPIFYDPGDLFRMVDTISRWPADFYRRHKQGLSTPTWDAMPAEGILALRTLGRVENPKGGYLSGAVRGFVVPVCHFGSTPDLKRIELHPGIWLPAPGVRRGLPLAATEDEGKRIVDHLRALSIDFGTSIEYSNGVGTITI